MFQHFGRAAFVSAVSSILLAGCGSDRGVTDPNLGGTAQDPVTLVGTMPPAYDVPSSIDTTGGTDVTQPLMAFIASVPDSSIVRFHRSARYRVEGTLLVKNRARLTFDGNGATLFATTDGSNVTPPTELANRWPRGRRHFLIEGGRWIVVRNLTIKGANPNAGTGDAAYNSAYEAQHGFEFAGVQGGELEHVTVTDVYGDFVYFGPYNGRITSQVRVHDSEFERNGRQGMAFTSARDITIERVTMGQVRRAHFDIEPNFVTDTVRRISIRGSKFGPGRLLFLASGGAGGLVEDISVTNNMLYGKPLNVDVKPPLGYRRARYTIRDNTSDTMFGSLAALINIARVDGVDVEGNTNPLDPRRSMTGVSVTESCGTVIGSNYFSGAAQGAVITSPSC